MWKQCFGITANLFRKVEGCCMHAFIVNGVFLIIEVWISHGVIMFVSPQYIILYNIALKSGRLIGGLASRDLNRNFHFTNDGTRSTPRSAVHFVLYICSIPRLVFH